MRANLFLIFMLALIGSSIILTQGCKHDPITLDDMDDMNPIDTTDNPVDTTDNPVDTTNNGVPCDPDLVYFDLEVLPILASNCAFSGCHDANTASDGVILDSYENVMATADVQPFDLGSSDLFEVITEDDEDKVMPPPPNNKLTTSQINLISKWILQGAKDLECDPDASGCDTVNVSFSADVQPVIQSNCQGCHSGSFPSGGIDLSNYTNIANTANTGQLYGAIAHLPGFSPMPQNQPQLSACTIKQIKAWIDEGALNN